MEKVENALKFALITPSYKPDFKRCQLLVESVGHCLKDDTKHYLVVDQQDASLFGTLASSRTEVLTVEELLPSWIFRVPGLQGWWMSLRTLPIRNWILQQLVKLAVCDAIDEDILVFCDSDNTFLRPFDMKSRFLQGDRLSFLRVDFQNREMSQWIEVSQQIFGIPEKSVPPVTYISNMITWHKSAVLKMREHIEAVNQDHWIRVICRYRHISEYMLYGVFVECILGIEPAHHFVFDTELIKPSWGYSLDTEHKIDQFFAQFEDSHIGVMIHSKDKIPVERYRDKITASWAQISIEEACQAL